MVKMWQVEDSAKKSGSFGSREDLTVSEDGERSLVGLGGIDY